MPSVTDTANPRPTAAMTSTTVTITAASAAAALAEVHERFGPFAAIVDARRQLRGGIAGFFCKESFEVDVATDNTRLPRQRSSDKPVARAGSQPPNRPRPATFTPARLPSPSVAGPAPSHSSDAADIGSPPDGKLTPSPPSMPSSQFAPTSPFERLLRQAEAADELALNANADVTAPDLQRAAAVLPPTATTSLSAPVATNPAVTPPAAAAPPATAAAAPPAAATATVTSPTAATTRCSTSLAEPTIGGTNTAKRELAHPRTVGLDLRNLVAWSARTLVRLGISPGFVASLDIEEGADDRAWTEAIERAVTPLCRPLPTGRFIVVGPEASRFGTALSAPIGRSPEFAAAMAGNRWAHLVVGGVGWRPALQFDPLAASWVEPSDLPDALRCATDLGMVLGYFHTGSSVTRATPHLVAQQLRDVVARCARSEERW